MASPEFNDSGWITIDSRLDSGISIDRFKGIGWFRTPLLIDSSLAGKPLAMSITHFGASEIYIDGVLIMSFGKIKDSLSTVNYDPQELPFIIIIPEPGEHVIAVRYANFLAKQNFVKYNQAFAGFKISIGSPDLLFTIKNDTSVIVSTILMFLAGIFFALCLLHLFLYLYYRVLRSNLFFSILMLAFTSILVIMLIYSNSNIPSLSVKSFFLLNPLLIISCLAVTGFINELFGLRKKILLGIYVLGISALIFRFVSFQPAVLLSILLVLTVSIIVLYSLIRGIIMGVKGAKIIGSGFLFAILFSMTLIAIGIIGNEIHLNDSTISGRILIVLSALAVLSIPLSMSAYLAWNFSTIHHDLGRQLQTVKELSKRTLEQEQEKQRILEGQKTVLEEQVLVRTAELREQKKKSDDLLLNILPAEVAEELKLKGGADARQYESVTVMFTDFKGFTQITERLSPAELVAEIHTCFKNFDAIISKYDIEKIKTIGDSYMCAGGIPAENRTNAVDVVAAALEFQLYIKQRGEERRMQNKEAFEIRIGIHTGPVVAGIVGVKKFAYDIWGDTVNIASRMESSGEAGKINISGSTYHQIKDKYNCKYRGKIQAKNKGECDMYFVEGEVGKNSD